MDDMGQSSLQSLRDSGLGEESKEVIHCRLMMAKLKEVGSSSSTGGGGGGGGGSGEGVGHHHQSERGSCLVS